MSTRINVNIGDGGLLDRNAQQQAAARQANQQRASADKAAAEGQRQLEAVRISQGRDPLTGERLPSAGSSSRIQRIDQEPAANRQGGLLDLLVVPSGPYITTPSVGPTSYLKALVKSNKRSIPFTRDLPFGDGSQVNTTPEFVFTADDGPAGSTSLSAALPPPSILTSRPGYILTIDEVNTLMQPGFAPQDNYPADVYGRDYDVFISSGLDADWRSAPSAQAMLFKQAYNAITFPQSSAAPFIRTPNGSYEAGIPVGRLSAVPEFTLEFYYRATTVTPSPRGRIAAINRPQNRCTTQIFFAGVGLRLFQSIQLTAYGNPIIGSDYYDEPGTGNFPVVDETGPFSCTLRLASGYLEGANNLFEPLEYPVSTEVGEWVHIALVRTRSSLGPVWSLYLSGQRVVQTNELSTWLPEQGIRAPGIYADSELFVNAYHYSAPCVPSLHGLRFTPRALYREASFAPPLSITRFA